MLSRDLLRAGLTGPSGEGDVRLWPARGGLDVVFLQLRAPSGEALFELSGAAVTDFLRETEQLVPVGTESDTLRVDDELSALLAAAGQPDGPLDLQDAPRQCRGPPGSVAENGSVRVLPVTRT